MVVEFTKMNGAGNDFVLIDNRAGAIGLDAGQVARLCDRQRGVGADGVMLLVPSSGKADWAWQFYNSDGSDAEMCGNGARCFARYIRKIAGANGDLSFETGAGIIHASFEGDRVTVNLTPPKDLHFNQSLSGSEGERIMHSVNTGVPHVVIFVDDADRAVVQQEGREIRFHERFQPQGTNVNFVQVLGEGRIRVRTYERGVEGETLACGTGVSAAALITAAIHQHPSPIAVQVRSGDRLEVLFDRTDGGFENVRLAGPAEFVFEGRIEL